MPMIAITTNNSTSVKPGAVERRRMMNAPRDEKLRIDATSRSPRCLVYPRAQFQTFLCTMPDRFSQTFCGFPPREPASAVMQKLDAKKMPCELAGNWWIVGSSHSKAELQDANLQEADECQTRSSPVNRASHNVGK